MKKILISLVILAVVGGLGYFLFKFRSTTPAPAEVEGAAAKVETTVLVEKPIAQTLELFGLVTSAPSGDNVIPALFDVIVHTIHVGVGTPVVPGDVLLETEPSPNAKLADQTAQGVLQLAQKTLTATQERYDLRLATRQELQSAQQAAEDAKLKADNTDLRSLGDGRITAPAAGVVSKLELVAGSAVPAGTALVTLSTTGQLEARLGAESTDLAALAPGQRVELASASRSVAEKFPGTVRSVGAALDAITGAAEVRVSLTEHPGLFLGEHVRAQVEVGRKDRALVVPRSAVLSAEGRNILFTVVNGHAVKHEVTLGLVTDAQVEVLGKDLHPGDRVVTLGNYELEDGMQVQATVPDETKAGPKVEAPPDAEAKP